MDDSGFQARRQYESLDRAAISQYQLTELNRLLETILPVNEFYADKLANVSLPLTSLDQLVNLPFTTKTELQQPDDFSANRTFPVKEYSRFHRTSGTHGRPMIVVDTSDDWQWWLDTWQYVLDVANVTPDDRVLMAFSFGPFIGFWSANDALTTRGAMVVPAGGLSSLGRLDLLKSSEATAICCTPSYALHLAEVARKNSFNILKTKVSRIIVAGEPDRKSVV
jgi:phenylacetate-CoA ligase